MHRGAQDGPMSFARHRGAGGYKYIVGLPSPKLKSNQIDRAQPLRGDSSAEVSGTEGKRGPSLERVVELFPEIKSPSH